MYVRNFHLKSIQTEHNYSYIITVILSYNGRTRRKQTGSTAGKKKSKDIWWKGTEAKKEEEVEEAKNIGIFLIK